MDKKVNCPICNEEMVVNGGDISHDFAKKKEYKRELYWCSKDDVWLTIEAPIKAQNSEKVL